MTPYYKTPWVTLYHGDCRELSADIIGDHVITDPPYDTRTHNGARRSKGAMNQIDFESCNPSLVAPGLLMRARRWVIAFCALEQLGAYQEAFGPAWIRSGIWCRTTNAPQFSGDRPGQACEGITFAHAPGKKRWNGGGHHALWSGPRERAKLGHPTPKPIWLMSELVRLFTTPGETVLDPYCGSGSTLIAARRYGCYAIGIEREERYCEIAAERLRQEMIV